MRQQCSAEGPRKPLTQVIDVAELEDPGRSRRTEAIAVPPHLTYPLPAGVDPFAAAPGRMG